jgi:hypothetical protein
MLKFSRSQCETHIDTMKKLDGAQHLEDVHCLVKSKERIIGEPSGGLSHCTLVQNLFLFTCYRLYLPFPFFEEN